jgi:hypothetical protein
MLAHLPEAMLVFSDASIVGRADIVRIMQMG